MSVSSVVDADYSTVIVACRNALNKGTALTGEDLRLVVAVVKDACSRLDGANGAVADIRATWDAQIAILQAGGAGDISAEVDAADTAIEADVVAAETARPAAPTYTSNPTLDA